METIDIQPLLHDAHGLFDALNQCIGRLNELTCQRNPKLKKYPFSVTNLDASKILLRFTPNKKSGFATFFDRVELEPDWNDRVKITFIQQFIFNACRAYGLFKDVPMCGALERNQRTYFSFEFEGTKYEYVLWTPPVEVAK